MIRKGSNTALRISLDHLVLHGELNSPEQAVGLVIFVHGSGSSRFSPRNKYVADVLNQRGLATLLLDLLTEEEHRIDSETMEFRFDIPMLGTRSTLVAGWALRQPDSAGMPIGLFGASTGAAAALITAATMKDQIAAVVSRGGRPDLAEDVLDQVEAPTLLIVGGDDETVLDLNGKAQKKMRCENRLHVVPGATHLFEETGALEQVARVAADWFVTHMEARKPREEKASVNRRWSA